MVGWFEVRKRWGGCVGVHTRDGRWGRYMSLDRHKKGSGKGNRQHVPDIHP